MSGNAQHVDHFLLADLANSSTKVIYREGNKPAVSRLDKRFVVSSKASLNERAAWEAIIKSIAETPDVKQWKLCGGTERLDRMLDLKGCQTCWELASDMNQISHHLDLETWKPFAPADWHSSYKFGTALPADVQVTAELFYGFFKSVNLPDMDIPSMTPQDFVRSATNFINGGNVFLLQDSTANETVGMVGAVASWLNPENGRKCARLALIYTPSQYRSKGLATLAMNRMLEVLKFDRGYKDLYLFTDVTKPAPNKLYRGLGFQPLEDYVLRMMKHSS